MKTAAVAAFEAPTTTARDASEASVGPGELWRAGSEAASLFAVDPSLGLRLRARAGFVRDRLMAELSALLPSDRQLRRMPAGCSAASLTGGLDLAATLSAARPIAERGLLEAAHGGVLVAAMAERMTPEATGIVVFALDTGTVRIERDGLSMAKPAAVGLLALDEGMAGDEAPPIAICERLALVVDLEGADPRGAEPLAIDRDAVMAARQRLALVKTDDRTIELLCHAAAALGVASLRAPILALKAARAAAALSGSETIDAAAFEIAVRHVLGPRATQIPEVAETPPDTKPEDGRSDGADRSDRPDDDDDDLPDKTSPDGDLREDITVEAAATTLPPDLLAKLAALARPSATRGASGRSGTRVKAAQRGRIVGTREGDPRRSRIDLIATLTAAAPWQPLRRDEACRAASSHVVAGVDRVIVRPCDFRIRRYKAKRETATIFCVDASGSAALARLAEAKGAVEIILAECYVRRDRVALVAFRGAKADVLLPETRSLTRAKRCLAAFPAGGGTPLASGISTALALADASAREGRTPLIAILTDGRANIASDGVAGRPAATRDAKAAAGAVRARGHAGLVIDTGQRPGQAAREIAEAMGARYLALPRVDSRALSSAVANAGSAGARRP